MVNRECNWTEAMAEAYLAGFEGRPYTGDFPATYAQGLQHRRNPMRRYGTSRDPYWLTARFDSECSQCKRTIKKGERAFYYPTSRRIFCSDGPCGVAASNDFETMRDAETALGGSR